LILHVLFAVFLALKMSGATPDLSWWTVFSPYWAGLPFYFLVYFLVDFCAVILKRI